MFSYYLCDHRFIFISSIHITAVADFSYVFVSLLLKLIVLMRTAARDFVYCV